MKILFISHDAYRTGAPILILNLAKMLAEESKHEIGIFVKNSYGDASLLVGEFKKIGPTYLSLDEILIKKRITRLDSLLGKKSSTDDLEFNYDVIISNTITNGELYTQLKKTKKPILTYVHELEMGVEAFTSKDNLNFVLSHSNNFIVPSEAVRTFLVKKLLIKPDKIERLDYFIPNFAGKDSLEGNQEKAQKNTFTIGSAGTTDWRKGGDLFVVIVKEYFSKYPDSDILFTWKGFQPDSLEYKRLQHDIIRAGLDGKIQYERSDNQMDSFYSKIDLFLLTSREDPYPLVVLEAAKHKVPTICFESSGGITEFVLENNGGEIVPYLSVSDLVETIRGYYLDRDKLLLHGNNAKQAVETLHQDKKRIINQFENILLNTQRII